MKALFILLPFLTSAVVAEQQIIQFVSFVNFSAGWNRAHLIIEKSAPNINTNGNTYEEIVAKTTYVGYAGWWSLYSNESYGGASWNTLYKDNPLEIQEGTLGQYVQSIRHLGPPDTDTVSVTAYSGVRFGGSAELVETENDIPFDAQSLFFTGSGTWNFYPGPDQGGDPVTYTNTLLPFHAYTSRADDWPAVLQGKVIKSIVRVA